MYLNSFEYCDLIFTKIPNAAVSVLTWIRAEPTGGATKIYLFVLHFLSTQYFGTTSTFKAIDTFTYHSRFFFFLFPCGSVHLFPALSRRTLVILGSLVPLTARLPLEISKSWRSAHLTTNHILRQSAGRQARPSELIAHVLKHTRAEGFFLHVWRVLCLQLECKCHLYFPTLRTTREAVFFFFSRLIQLK